MQVKKFEAQTIQEALDTVKRELGPEAVILQTKRHRKGFGLLSNGSVEVTAAVSERDLGVKKSLEKKLPTAARSSVSEMRASQQAAVLSKYEDTLRKRASKFSLGGIDRLAQDLKEKVSFKKKAPPKQAAPRQRYVDIDPEARPVRAQPTRTTALPPAGATAGAAVASELIGEVNRLKKMVHELKEKKPSEPNGVTFGSAAIEESFEQLVVNGVEKRLALDVVKSSEKEIGELDRQDRDSVKDQIALEIMNRTEVVSVLQGIEKKENRHSPPQKIALIGPTGVGKTTTIAKVASEAALNRGLKVALINIDTYKIAAREQLSTYAKLMNTPFRTVHNEEELKRAVGDFNFCDLILIDTTGRSQKDTNGIHETKEILESDSSIRTLLVLSSTTRDLELLQMGKRFSVMRPESLIMSKLDETDSYGAIYNSSQKLKLPLAYFTTGQRVPEDLEESTKERMASLLLEI